MNNVWRFLFKDPEWIMILLSSLTSATLCGLMFNKDNAKEKTLTHICEVILFPVLAIVLGIAAIALFALYQHCSIGSGFLQTTTNIINYFIREKLFELIGIPILVEICMILLSLRGYKKTIYLVLFVVSFIAMTIIPNFITFRTYYPLAIEESILQEVQRTPITWNVRINDIETFRTRAKQGYMIYGKLEEEGTTETLDNEKTTQSTTAPNESSLPNATEENPVMIDNLSFSELLVYINDEIELNKQLAKAALKRADTLFADGNYVKNNYDDIGIY